MGGYAFEAVLVRPEGVGTWTFLNIPLEVSNTFGSKGQVKVKGTINGYPYRSTALPMGDGTHYLVVGRDIRDHVHATEGDTIKVIMELDTEERQVEIPEVLQNAMKSHPNAVEAFDRMTYSHKKEWINWILSAKQVETRQRRAEKAIATFSQGKNLRDLSRRG